MKHKHHTGIPLAFLISVLCILLLILFAILFWPSGDKHEIVPEIEIKDQCGRFANLISHTISNSETCRIRCEDQCEATDRRLVSNRFIESANSCNQCFCTCKPRGLFS